MALCTPTKNKDHSNEGMVKNAKEEMEKLIVELGSCPVSVENYEARPENSLDDEPGLEEQHIQHDIDTIRAWSFVSKFEIGNNPDGSMIIDCNLASKEGKAD